MVDAVGQGPGSGCWYTRSSQSRKADYSTYPESQIDHARVAEQGVLSGTGCALQHLAPKDCQ